MTGKLEQFVEKPEARVEHDRVGFINAFFRDLVDPNAVATLTTERTEELKGYLRIELAAAGIDFEKLQQPDNQQRLKAGQLRVLTKDRTDKSGAYLDRGPALAIAMDDEWQPEISIRQLPRCLALRAWAQSVSVDNPKLKDTGEHTRRRGAENQIADIIAFAAGAISAEKFLSKTKKRIGRHYESELLKEFGSKIRCVKIKAENRYGWKISEGYTHPNNFTGDLKEIWHTLCSQYGIPVDASKDRDSYQDVSRITPEAMQSAFSSIINFRKMTSEGAETYWKNSGFSEEILFGNDRLGAEDSGDDVE